MDVLTQAYAHLDYKSKIASADKMAWIGSTSLALDMGVSEPILPPIAEKANNGNNSIQALSDFMHSLITSNVPMGVIQAWLAQVDLQAASP